MDEILSDTYSFGKISRLAAAGGAAALVIGSSVVAYFDPSEQHFFPVCPLYQLTGFACPGCGLTRAFHAFFHGNMAAALHFNLFTPVWAVVFAVALVLMLVYAVTGKSISLQKVSPNWLLGFVVILLIFGVVRNIPAYPFNLLFP